MKEYRNFIDGRWIPAKSGRTTQSTNPATGEVLGVVPDSGPDDVRAAVEAATAAYPKWRTTPAPRRGELLFALGEILKEEKQALGEFLTMEMGKVLPEGLGDVQEAIDMAFYMGAEGRRLMGATVPSEMPNKFAMATRDAVGVCGIITPWNFPIAIPSWKMFPALVAGNTVVFKPATETAILGVKFVQLMERAGFPPGVVNLVVGSGADVGQPLVEHPDVKVISFTGSTATGKRVLGSAADTLKKVHLELGGKNAIIVMDDADLELAVDSIVWSAFGTAGQRCTAASRVIVHRAVSDTVVERLVARANALRLGDGLSADVDVGPVINRSALEKIHGYGGIARDEGVTIAAGGEPWAGEGRLAEGVFYKPTVFTDVRPEHRVAQEEIFGPCTSVIVVDSLEEAIRVNNGVAHGLSSSLFTRDVNAAFRAIRDFDTGLVYINHGTIGAEIQLPFGGNKATGNGMREAGIAGLDVFTVWKSIYVDYSGRLQRAQIDTEKVLREETR